MKTITITLEKTKMFVPRYIFPRYNITRQDFKGHQLKALRKLDTLKPQIHLICEIRDIRAPLSTRNVLIDKIIDNRIHQRLVVYTKSDLMSKNPLYLQKLHTWHQQLGEKYIILNAKNPTDVSNLLRTLRFYKLSYQQDGPPLPMGYKTLITGMPNVGKSTLINSLRSLNNQNDKKVAKTGAEAGITRSTSELIRIGSIQDHLYLIDSPGIGLPGRLNARDRMLVLSLCGCIKQGVVDPLIEADYLLFLVNLQRDIHNPILLKSWYPGADTNPTNDIEQLLERTRRNPKVTHDDLARSWIRQCTAQGNVIFDKELLLHTDEFSLKRYVTNELSQAVNIDVSSQNSRRPTNNTIFGKRPDRRTPHQRTSK